MRRFVMVIAFIATLFSTAPVFSEPAVSTADVYEYVFSEAELRDFLAENIQEAVDKVTADLTRDHLIDKVLWEQQLGEQKDRVDVLEKDLKVANVKLVFSVSVAAAAGVGIGYLFGKLF